MKQYLVLFTLVTITVSAKAQSVEWTKTYGDENEDHGVRLIETPDNYYTLLGRNFSRITGNVDYWLLKLDQAGDTLWSAKYTAGPTSNGPKDLITTSDDGLVLCGTTALHGPDSTFMLMKTDASGIASWTGCAGFQACPYAVRENSSGEFVTAGTTIGSTANLMAHVVSFNPTGDSLWSTAYGTKTFTVSFQDVVLMDNDVIFAVGSSYDSEVYENDPYLAKISAEGATLWSGTFGSTDFGEWALCVAAISDSTIVVGGIRDNKAALWVLDTSCTVLDVTTFGDEPNNYVEDVASTGDGGFVLCATTGTSTPAVDYRAVIQRYSRAGYVIWEHTVTPDYTEVHARSINRTDAGGYIFAGYCDSPENRTEIYALGIGCCEFRGDLDDDGTLLPLDLVYFVNWLWRGGPEPPCMNEADVNGDSSVDPQDCIYLVNYMWGYGPAPVPCL